MGTPEEILKSCWGYDAFRPMQREIIDAALAGRDVLTGDTGSAPIGAKEQILG